MSLDSDLIRAYNVCIELDGEEIRFVNQASVKLEEKMRPSELYIPRKPVESSNLESVGYNKRFQTLEVEFKGKRVYRYYDVPELVYQDLMNASSHGQFLNKEIKGEYSYEQV